MNILTHALRVLLVLVLLGACASLELRERFTPLHGQAAPVRAAEDDGDVKLFVETAPEGFAWTAGQPEVQVGYNHIMLGHIELYLEDGLCRADGHHALSRRQVFARLKRRAEREGGNAVIYVTTEALDEATDDCARLESRKQAGYRAGPWASGYVVQVAKEQHHDLLPLAEEDEPSDAGIGDAPGEVATTKDPKIQATASISATTSQLPQAAPPEHKPPLRFMSNPNRSLPPAPPPMEALPPAPPPIEALPPMPPPPPPYPAP